MGRHFFFILRVILLMIVVSGCVMIPIPTSEKKILSGKPVKEEQLSFLHPEVTTKLEVIEQLGTPNVIWEDARMFVYVWEMRQGILFWAVGGYASGNVGLNDIPKHYLLMARFNEQDKVIDFSRTARPMLHHDADVLKTWLAKSAGALPGEEAGDETEKKVVVLLNIQCTIDNQPQEPFIKFSLTKEPIFAFGIGTFKTMGEPQPAFNKFLSEESRRAGWTYFSLSPGTYYLAILGPDSSAVSITDAAHLQKSPRWRMDIPQGAKAVYVGTLQFSGKDTGGLLFGAKNIEPTEEEPTIRDDHLMADDLISKHFPEAGKPQTVLLQRWHPGDPVIIRSQPIQRQAD